MYDFKTKQANIMKNSFKAEDPRTKYFNEKTKQLIGAGYSRKVAREIIRHSLKPDIKPSQFSKNNLRKTRKERSKRLKMPFNALYNGPVYKQVYELDIETNKYEIKYLLVGGGE